VWNFAQEKKIERKHNLESKLGFRAFFVINFKDRSMSRIIELYLCRHAETTANRDDILQGHCDYELTDEGVEASRLTGRHFFAQQLIFNRVCS